MLTGRPRRGSRGIVGGASVFRARTICTVVLGILPSITHAQAANISGRVSDATGAGLGGICVYAFSDIDWSSAETDANGIYRVVDLTAGSYRVSFDDCSGEYRFASEYYDDKVAYGNADLVTLGEGEERSGIDAVLSRPGAARGRVTNENGDGLADICVSFWIREGEYEFVSGTLTDGAGDYSVDWLRPGDYTVLFHDCEEREYAFEWYDDQASASTANPVTVSDGAVSEGIDAVLSRGGAVSGTVTNAAGNPLENVCVSVIDAADAFPGWSWGTTDELGRYEARGLRSGDYKVSFAPCREIVLATQPGPRPLPGVQPGGLFCSGPQYVSEWYDDEDDFESADEVTVVAPSITGGVDAVLAARPGADLTVTDLVVERPANAEDDNEFRRLVHVRIANLGTEEPETARLEVTACGKTAGCSHIGSAYLGVQPGEEIPGTFEWDTLRTGSIGDLEVKAQVGALNDVDCDNNEKTIEYSSVAGGAGVGVSIEGRTRR